VVADHEHYFQAQKFAGTVHAEVVRRARTPKEAANLGRRRDLPLRRDWERVKDDLMRRVVLRKFETHADIRAILLGTGEESIVENAPGDYYWGCGADGSGKNMLGHILVEVRTQLRRQLAGAVGAGDGRTLGAVRAVSRVRWQSGNGSYP